MTRRQNFFFGNDAIKHDETLLVLPHSCLIQGKKGCICCMELAFWEESISNYPILNREHRYTILEIRLQLNLYIAQNFVEYSRNFFLTYEGPIQTYYLSIIPQLTLISFSACIITGFIFVSNTIVKAPSQAI